MPAAVENQITAAFVQQFDDTFELECQQMKSALDEIATNKGEITGKSFTINDMGSIEMKSHNRLGDTVWTIPEAGERTALMDDFDLFVPIAPADLPKLKANPQDPYMQNILAAVERKRDESIFGALPAAIMRKDEYAGTKTPVSLPSSQKIAAGGTPFTKAKIVQSKKILTANHALKKGEFGYMIYDAEMQAQIMMDETLTKWDMESLMRMREGEVAVKWAGFIWLPYEGIAQGATASEKRTYATVKGAVHRGENTIQGIDIDKNPAKNNTKQISTIRSFGAGRANEKKVVEIDFVV